MDGEHLREGKTMTADDLLQHRNGIIHLNLLDFIKSEAQF